MKKLFKYTMAVVLGAFALASCTNEYEYDAPSLTDQGGNATISTEKTAFVFVPGEDQEYVVTITRVDTTQAETISLTCDNEKFTVPATVEFAAEEKTKDVTITSNVEAGGNEVANISIAEGNAFLYGSNTVTFTVNVYRSFPGMIQSAFYGGSWQMVVYELEMGKYMIPNAFADGYDFYFDIDYTTNKVTIANQFIDYYNETYGRIRIKVSEATYDPESHLITATAKFDLPDSGYSFNGTQTVYILFGVNPQE